MSTLPLAPLTIRELLDRGRDAREEIAYYVLALADADEIAAPRAGHLEFLAQRSATAKLYREAARVRIGGPR